MFLNQPSEYFISLLPFLPYVPDMTVPYSYLGSDPLCVVPPLLTFPATEFLPHTVDLELCSAALANHLHSHAPKRPKYFYFYYTPFNALKSIVNFSIVTGITHQSDDNGLLETEFNPIFSSCSAIVNMQIQQTDR